MVTMIYRDRYNPNEDLSLYGAFKYTEPNSAHHEQGLKKRPTLLKVTPNASFVNANKVSFGGSTLFPKEYPFYYI